MGYKKAETQRFQLFDTVQYFKYYFLRAVGMYFAATVVAEVLDDN